MKNLFIALATLVAVGCSKDGGDPEPEPNTPTTFVFRQTIDNLLSNCMAGYYTPDGFCKKLGDLGDLSRAGQLSSEITITIDTLNYVYFFNDHGRFESSFKLEQNKRNIFDLRADAKGIEVDKTDPAQYPH
jgi:hypothetical protein